MSKTEVFGNSKYINLPTYSFNYSFIPQRVIFFFSATVFLKFFPFAQNRTMCRVECSTMTSLGNVWRKEKVSEKMEKKLRKKHPFLRENCRQLHLLSYSALQSPGFSLSSSPLPAPLWLGDVAAMSALRIWQVQSLHHFLCLPFLFGAWLCVYAPMNGISGTHTSEMWISIFTVLFLLVLNIHHRLCSSFTEWNSVYQKAMETGPTFLNISRQQNKTVSFLLTQ